MPLQNNGDNKNLALDISLEKARALHRVWRALNDGDCPKCHSFNPAGQMIRSVDSIPFFPAIACPVCNFQVTHEEIKEIERMFAPAMDAAVEIFEKWRNERNEQSRPTTN